MHAELNNEPGEKRRSCSDVEGVLAADPGVETGEGDGTAASLAHNRSLLILKTTKNAEGCELAKAARAEDDAAVEAGDGCVLVQDLEKNCDRGKMCFGFENGDGKGSVRLKVGKWWGGPAGWEQSEGLFGRLRGRRKQREKAGIGEKGVLVLWLGVCQGKRISGCFLLAGRGGRDVGPAASFSFFF
ncbi:hypothetical protein NC651_037972 [Populus alba x Populus x berolinensis]|nr:hypothetical protein NC651_037972 [Populus alba x Populus x berolinensis]